MRGGIFPARRAESARRASASTPSRAWSAATSPARSRSRSRASTRATATARGSSRSTPASSARSSATSPRAARRSRSTRARRTAEELLARDPDGFFLVPGPGDPAALDYIVDTIRDAARHASRCSASASATSCSRAPSGLETFKLPFGHRGANHPVKDLRTGRIAITSQNHGFAVAGQRRGEIDRVRPRRRAADPREPLRRHDRGHPPARRPRRLRPVPPRGRARARTTRLGLFDEFIDAVRRMPRRRRPPQDPRARLRPDRDRPGRRVRLLRRAGLQGPARGGLRGRARELQPGDDHDRPGVRDRDLRRAAAARARCAR